MAIAAKLEKQSVQQFVSTSNAEGNSKTCNYVASTSTLGPLGSDPAALEALCSLQVQAAKMIAYLALAEPVTPIIAQLDGPLDLLGSASEQFELCACVMLSNMLARKSPSCSSTK